MVQADTQRAAVEEQQRQGFRIVIWEAEYVCMAKGWPGTSSWTPIQVYPDGRVVRVEPRS